MIFPGRFLGKGLWLDQKADDRAMVSDEASAQFQEMKDNMELEG